MSISSTYSISDSYTVVDVRKVMDQIHADLRMISQSTGLWTQTYADTIMSDVLKFAEKKYLKRIRIRLVGSDGKNVRVSDYVIHERVTGWVGDRAGGNLWKGMANRMAVTITYSDAWEALSEAAKAAFRASLNLEWSTTTDDLSVSHLWAGSERTYVSNGYGVKRTVYG